MTCSQPGEPMIGGFGTWRNVPITFDAVDPSSATVQAANYLRITPNTEESAPRWIEIGLYAAKTGRTTQKYGPSWFELTASGGRTKAITAGINPTKPDGRTHTYMAVRQSSGNQWDVLYDFNKVGQTSSQYKVPRGNSNRIDIGLEVTGPQFTNVPAIANRMQFMTENKNWQRVASQNTARVVSLPVCSAAQKPPYCFSSRLTGGTAFTQWTVSKPRKPSTLSASQTDAVTTVVSGRPRGTFNGVDQGALRTCLEQSPNSCLETVPGLSECVMTARVCNEAALRANQASSWAAGPLGSSAGAATPSMVRADAASAFGVAPSAVTVTAPIGSYALAGSESTWTVTSTAPTRGLRDVGRMFRGFTAHYSARTGALVDACWGRMCDS
ncbi:hypothetical protein [Streptomyces sp. NPDC006879]|uniref:hypothetical protein n=1 Tax=Streptomyces sp. NPDC006879 TaxID=3364767 RepID=UPI0036948A01